MREITVRASLDRIETVTDMVNGLLDETDCPEEIRLDIDVVIDELFGNIARYAYGTEGGTVTVCAEAAGNPLTVSITFTDRGRPFNPLSEGPPDTTMLPARKRPIGGLGLILVRKIMDDITYNYENGQNKLTVRKAIERNGEYGKCN